MLRALDFDSEAYPDASFWPRKRRRKWASTMTVTASLYFLSGAERALNFVAIYPSISPIFFLALNFFRLTKQEMSRAGPYPFARGAVWH